MFSSLKLADLLCYPEGDSDFLRRSPAVAMGQSHIYSRFQPQILSAQERKLQSSAF